MGVLEIEDAWCAVCECAGEALAGGYAGCAVKPLDGAGDVGERSAILTIRVELGSVIDDEALVLADRGGCREHAQRELAGGLVVVDGKVGTRNQGSFAGNCRDSIGLEDLCVDHLGCRTAHAAAGAAGESIKDGGVPCVAHAGVLDIETELSQLSWVHRRRSRFGKYKVRCGGSPNIDRGTRACHLLRSVPSYDAGVGECCAAGKTGSNLHSKPYVDGLAGLQ